MSVLGLLFVAGCNFQSEPLLVPGDAGGDGVGTDADADGDADTDSDVERCYETARIVGTIDALADGVPYYSVDHYQLTVGGGHAYVDLNLAGFKVFDISDPTSPAEVGRFDDRQNPSLGGLAFSDPYLVTQGENGGEIAVLVFDVSDPSHPGQRGVTNLTMDGGMGRAVDLVDPRVVVASQSGSPDASFDFVDFSDPDAPTIVATLPNHRIFDLAFFDDFAIANVQHDWDAPEGEPVQELEALDLSDSAHPVILGAKTVGFVDFIERSGDYLFAIIEHDLVAFDVSDPTDPTAVATLAGLMTLDRGVGRLVSAGDFLLYAEGDEVQFVDTSDPLDPWIASTLPLPRDVRQMWVFGRYAYVMVEDISVAIVDLGC